jgi:XRE family transcriptional regulator, regulator of sulfur utilization
MITRRDLVTVALALSVGATLGHVATAGTRPSVQQSELFDWNALSANPTEVGQLRHILRAPTATLDELEMHATTLNPGLSSHPPHRHPNEELVIIASGKLEAMSNGKTRVLGPGSVIFNASNQLHSVRNVGDVPATYHVINWTAPGMRAQAEAATPEPAQAQPVAPAKPGPKP